MSQQKPSKPHNGPKQSKSSGRPFKILTSESSYAYLNASKFTLQPGFQKDLQQKIKYKMKHRNNRGKQIFNNEKQWRLDDQTKMVKQVNNNLDSIYEEEIEIPQKKNASQIFNQKLLFQSIKRKYEKQLHSIEKNYIKIANSKRIKSNYDSFCQHLPGISSSHDKGSARVVVPSKHRLKNRKSHKPQRYVQRSLLSLDGKAQNQNQHEVLLLQKSPLTIKAQAINERMQTNPRQFEKLKENTNIIKMKYKVNKDIFKVGNKESDKNKRFCNQFDKWRATQGYLQDSYDFLSASNAFSGWNNA